MVQCLSSLTFEDKETTQDRTQLPVLENKISNDSEVEEGEITS